MQQGWNEREMMPHTPGQGALVGPVSGLWGLGVGVWIHALCQIQI